MEHERDVQVLIVYEHRLFGQAIHQSLEDQVGLQSMGCVSLEQALLNPAILRRATTVIVECDTANIASQAWSKLLLDCDKGTQVILLDRPGAKMSVWTCVEEEDNVETQGLIRAILSNEAGERDTTKRN